MKRVKKQKTRLQQYQQYVNKKIAAVCAMTLSMSVLLSPFATSANNSSYPILISSVSEELTQSDNYVNVALSYHDIEETQLSVTMDITVNLDNDVTDEEQTEVVDDSNEINEENSAIEDQGESSENSEGNSESEVTDEIAPNENGIVDEEVQLPEGGSDESNDTTVNESQNTDPSSEDSNNEVIEENPSLESDSLEGQEETQQDNTTLEAAEVGSIANLLEGKNPIFAWVSPALHYCSQWITNIFSSANYTQEFVVEAAEVQEKSVVIDFPIHSSFSLDESTLKILGVNGEELSPSLLEVNNNHLTLGFAGEVPEQFNVFFLLNRSETIQSGQVVVNENSVIRYNVKGEDETKELTVPTMKVNFYELTQTMSLPTLESSFYQLNTTDESDLDASSHQIEVELENNNILYLDKTATEQGDGSYLIKLNTSGVVQATQTLNKADIVLVVDKSGSMSDKLDGTNGIKNSIKEFTKDVLSINTAENPNMVRVAIVTYDQYANNLLGGFVSQYTTCKKEGSCSNKNDENKNSVEYKITNIGANGGTNTEAGIKKAGELLTNAAQESGRSGAQQYVVFFTDGLPTYNDRYSGSDGSTYYGRNFRAAQESYYDYFKGPLLQEGSNTISVGGIGEVESKREWVSTGLWPWDGYWEYNENQDDLGSSYTLTNTPLDAKFYSIGLFTNSDDSKDAMAKAFLQTIQNVIKVEDYATNYYTNDIEKAKNIYTNIKGEIVSEIKGNLLTNVTITDIIPDYLSIVKDTVSGGSVDSTGKEITWEFDTLTEDGVEVSFKVIPNDPYLGGTNIPTNVSATITANEINKPEGELYPVPKIDINPVQGGIRVDKQVIKSDGTLFTTDEKFTINVTRMKDNLIQEQLGFNVAGNNVDKTVSFYLKGETTNISFNNDKTKNYLTVGTYSVDEVVPANYRKDSVSIKVCSNANYNTDSNSESCRDAVVDKNGRFTIDKHNRYILITVVNKLVNENYWYDKKHTPNEFIYTKPASSGDIAITE